MSGLYEVNRRRFSRTTRVWFRCDECAMYGDFTTPTTNADTLLADMQWSHTMQHRNRTEVPS